MDRLIDVTKLRLPCKGDYFKCIKGGAAKYDCFNCNREITASAQDAKTAHLVAHEIFKELEERCPHIPDVFDWKKRQCLICFEAIKERHGVLDA